MALRVIPEDKLLDIIKSTFSFKPAAMIQYLEPSAPSSRNCGFTAIFGRTDPDFTWEYISKIDVLRERAGLKGPLPSAPASRKLRQLNLHPNLIMRLV